MRNPENVGVENGNAANDGLNNSEVSESGPCLNRRSRAAVSRAKAWRCRCTLHAAKGDVIADDFARREAENGRLPLFVSWQDITSGRF